MFETCQRDEELRKETPGIHFSGLDDSHEKSTKQLVSNPEEEFTGSEESNSNTLRLIEAKPRAEAENASEKFPASTRTAASSFNLNVLRADVVYGNGPQKVVLLYEIPSLDKEQLDVFMECLSITFGKSTVGASLDTKLSLM